MHIYAPNGTAETYPYSIGQLRKDNPQTSFPRNPSAELLASYDVFPVTRVDRPSVDPLTHRVTEGTPELVDGVWTQVWVVTEATPEEIQQYILDQTEQMKALRAEAYREEADPLFFKAERGEGTKAEWEAKVAAIRARYPYPEAGV